MEFKIQTPLGPYSPDWVVLIEAEGEEKLYFVVESKGAMFTNRPTEEAKIDCAIAHFEAVGDGVKCFEADNYNEVTKHF